MRHILSFGILAVFLGTAVACATPSAVQNASTPAERLYRQAEVRFDRGEHTSAIEYYNQVRNEHPYSRYAKKADLRIADAYFEQGQWSSASEQYRTFIKLHPKHDKVAYARFRIGKAMYEKMPDNWFFLPPAHERDLSSTKRAARELSSFVESHPDSEYIEEAREMMREARRRLADHEMYVANFYLERDNARGAKMRLKYLLNNYSGLGLDAKALYRLAIAHTELDEPARARTALQDLMEYHPDSEYAERAKNYMDNHDLADSSQQGAASGG
jgi:outer membrane protein assembly factor BamD